MARDDRLLQKAGLVYRGARQRNRLRCVPTVVQTHNNGTAAEGGCLVWCECAAVLLIGQPVQREDRTRVYPPAEVCGL